MQNVTRTIQVSSETQTRQLAATLARLARHGDVILLNGDLGAGKTLFARAFIQALSTDKNIDVPSPTFTLLQNYDVNGTVIWHFDLYRLSDPDEIYEIGWEDALAGGISLIEWPERLDYHIDEINSDKLLTINIKLDSQNPDNREIDLYCGPIPSDKTEHKQSEPAWHERLKSL